MPQAPLPRPRRRPWATGRGLGGGGVPMTPDPASLAHFRHELRTPLNHVLGYSEMLLEDAGEAGELARELRGVRGEGRALLAAVEESLAPARVEAGGVDVGPPRLGDRASPRPPRSGSGPARPAGGRGRRQGGLGGRGTHRRGGGAAASAGRGLGSPSRSCRRGRSGRRVSPGGDGPARERSPRPGARRPRRPRSSWSTTTRRTASS